MKKKRQQNPRDWHERRLEAERYQDRPRLTLGRPGRTPPAEVTKSSGQPGLGNEPIPGHGARTRKPAGKPAKKTPAGKAAKRKRVAHDKEPLGRVAPLPPDKPKKKQREEQSDTFAREQERDTGVSGHMSGD